MKRVGKYFMDYEFRCPCCNKLKLDRGLVALLDEIRDISKSPIIVTSGYRCEKHNMDIGGSPNSKHLYGIAADITSPKILAKDLYHIVESILGDSGGLGYYPIKNILHVDIRKEKARWYEVKPGKYEILTPEKAIILGLKK